MILAARLALALLLGLSLAASLPSAAADSLDARQRAEDFDTLWRAVDERYAYFGRHRATWRRVREAWRPRALRATTRVELVAALEGAIEQLRDDHAYLSERTALSRRAPTEFDAWAAWSGKDAYIEAIRAFGDADVAGLRPGHVVTRVNGIPVERAVRDRIPRRGAADPQAEFEWALRRLVAGPREGALQVEVREAAGARTLTIEHRNAAASSNGPVVIGRRMGMERNLGYLRIKAPLVDPRVLEQFEGALNHVKDTRALILDLRETAGDGGTATVEAIVARFARATTPWRQREARGGPRVIDTVDPRAPLHAGPVVVLVDRWTAGDGESLAAGLNAVAGARLVGTAMAGLHGEVAEVRLPHSGIVARFPVQKTFHADGAARESVLPSVAVNLAAPEGGPGDPILYQALKLLER